METDKLSHLGLAQVKDAWERVGNHHNIVLDANMSCADVPNPGIEGTFTCGEHPPTHPERIWLLGISSYELETYSEM